MSRDVESIITQIIQGVNGDAALVRRGRYVNLTFQLGIDNHNYLVTVDNGRLTDIQPRLLSTETGVFSVRAKSEHWHKFWLPVPPRDYQDLFSMLPKQYAQIDGNVLPLMQNLQYFKDVLACGRLPQEGAANA